jgi:hypothetical protein
MTSDNALIDDELSSQAQSFTVIQLSETGKIDALLSPALETKSDLKSPFLVGLSGTSTLRSTPPLCSAALDVPSQAC